MSDPIKQYIERQFTSCVVHINRMIRNNMYRLTVFSKIKISFINAWKTKSFGFAFFGVFIFGSMLLGFCMPVLASLLKWMHWNTAYPLLGNLTFWGIIHLSLQELGFRQVH